MSNAEWRWWFIIGGFVGLLAVTGYLIYIYERSQTTPEERRQAWMDKKFDAIQCEEWRGLCLCLGRASVYGAFAFEAPPYICGIEQ